MPYHKAQHPGSVDVRGLNRRAILGSIFCQGETSRVALSRLVGISKPAISENLMPFLASGLVEEFGEGESGEGGGRRPKMLRLNVNHRFIIAIDLHGAELVFALGNLNNEVLDSFTVALPEGAGSDAYLDVLQRGIERLMARRNAPIDCIASIAVASPGAYDDHENRVGVNEKYLGAQWAMLNLRTLLRQRFRVDSMLINDINAAALGERFLSGDPRADNMLFISCGLGFGAGIILGGRLYHGRHFAAGEIYNYADESRIARGVGLEEEICVPGLLRRVREASEAAGSRANGRFSKLEDVVRAHREGDPAARGVVKDIAHTIAVVALNCASLLDVEKVVFGGDYRAFGEPLLSEMHALSSRLSPIPPDIALSTPSNCIGIHGLLYAAREKYFDDVCNTRGDRGGIRYEFGGADAVRDPRGAL